MLHLCRPLAYTLAGLIAFCWSYPATSLPAAPVPTELLKRARSMAGASSAGWDSVWKSWGLESRPENLVSERRERYGLHVAPYDNGNLAMGLAEVDTVFGPRIATDCLLCHASSLNGRPVIGLGNASLDIQSLAEDVLIPNELRGAGLFVPTLARVRGTIEASNSIVSLLRFRNADLDIVEPLPLEFNLPMVHDIPAWWLAKKKRTFSHTGRIDARSVRPFMTILLGLTNSAEQIKREEEAFEELLDYVKSIEAPEYPFPVDKKKAARGKKVFRRNCSRCHGTYGEQWTYPNKIIPLDEIGTDPAHFTSLDPRAADHYAHSWFTQERFEDSRFPSVEGYQAPPLDGVWATAPYLHNGSVPTVYHLLKSTARPRLWARSFRTDSADYDQRRLGWITRVLTEESLPGPDASKHARRSVYDTRRPGQSNRGHTFGDELSDGERWAVIEHLKTL